MKRRWARQHAYAKDQLHTMIERGDISGLILALFSILVIKTFVALVRAFFRLVKKLGNLAVATTYTTIFAVQVAVARNRALQGNDERTRWFGRATIVTRENLRVVSSLVTVYLSLFAHFGQGRRPGGNVGFVDVPFRLLFEFRADGFARAPVFKKVYHSRGHRFGGVDKPFMAYRHSSASDYGPGMPGSAVGRCRDRKMQSRDYPAHIGHVRRAAFRVAALLFYGLNRAVQALLFHARRALDGARELLFFSRVLYGA